ncbi:MULTISPECIES: GNAT family N-acetyltransferase [unclassified Clostridium]|uniref:GNAT family N-acetyltransferase n=1 Tax=unclassified Clostridium TaxID=2614128 RepID=UPI0025C0D34D|nr:MULTISPECIES: GNAT family N-acetyltransferase [unclassified Clostridium]
MVTYKRCSEVDINSVYEAFQIGFSDYIIKINMSKDDFITRFLGPEGNCLEHSFVALDENKAVGVILGGIKVYEGIKTIRCGTLGIHPEYRGKGISNRLFELHKEEGIKNECKQLFLEVIVGNDRAVNFYKKLGYEKIYDLSYYSFDDTSKLKKYDITNVHIRKIDLSEFEKVIDKAKDIHINWQNDMDYVKKCDNTFYYGSYYGDELVGSLCISSNGKLSFLWIKSEFRGKGIATSLLNKACEELAISKIAVAFPNNNLLQGFLKHMNFKKDNINQYEMYLTL